MLFVTTETVGDRRIEPIGIVKGWGMLAFGVNLEKAANRADAQLEKNAKELKADAVVNVRYSFGGGDTNCVLASGTAVRFI